MISRKRVIQGIFVLLFVIMSFSGNPGKTPKQNELPDSEIVNPWVSQQGQWK